MKILKFIILLVLSSTIIQLNAQSETNTFYVNPNGNQGNDTNDGSINSPWKTLNYALKDAPVSPGDTILLKPGRYTEKKVVIKNFGNSNNWVTVLGLTENGQRPLFDGTDTTLSNLNHWTRVPDSIPEYGGGKAIYEYKNTIDNNKKITQYRGFYEFRSQKNALVTYKNKLHFTSVHEHSRVDGTDQYGHYFYSGPGTFYDTLTNKLYLRLQVPSTNVVPENRTFIVANQQIAKNKIKLDLARITKHAFVNFFQTGANHIRFNNLDFYNHHEEVFLTGGAQKVNHIEFKNLSFATQGQSIKFSRTNNIKVEHCDFVGYTPLYIGFQETKSKFWFVDDAGVLSDTTIQLPAGNISVEAVTFLNESKDITVSNCSFTKMFDALSITNSKKDTIITPEGDTIDWKPENITVNDCYFKRLLDDAISISADAKNVNIYNNKYEDVPVGLSLTKAPINLPLTDLGQVYFHHNIVMTTPRFATKPNHKNATPQFNLRMPLLITHSGSSIGHFSIKAYHNTFIVRNGYKDHWVSKDKTTTLVIPFIGKGKSDTLDLSLLPFRSNEVYNNIFFHENMDFSVFRLPNLTNGKEVYDGNLYYRTTANVFPYEPPFRHMLKGDYGGIINGAYETLDTIRNHAKYHYTQAYNSAFSDIGYNGFESNGEQTDVLPIAMNTWKPITQAAKTGAIDLSSKSWPGLNGESFRGAKPPSSSSRIKIEDYQLTSSIFPNPFSNSVQLNYSVSQETHVTLTLTDLNGRIIAQPLNNKTHTPGFHQLTINTEHLPAGIYFCRLQVGQYFKTHKINCIK